MISNIITDNRKCYIDKFVDNIEILVVKSLNDSFEYIKNNLIKKCYKLEFKEFLKSRSISNPKLNEN